MIALNDRGLLLGDGLFETLLAADGQLMHLERHLERLAAGCAVLGLPFSRSEVERQLCAATPPQGVHAVRLTLTAGAGGRGLDRPSTPLPTLFATAAPWTPPTTPATAVIVGVRRNEGSPASRLKTLSYIDSVVARREAAAAGADEAILLNNRGALACAAAANLFWISRGRIHTPRLDCGVLAGVTRARLLARLEVAEVAEGPEVLATADAVFLTNSLIGVRPVSRLGDQIFTPHPRLDAIRAALDD